LLYSILYKKKKFPKIFSGKECEDAAVADEEGLWWQRKRWQRRCCEDDDKVNEEDDTLVYLEHSWSRSSSTASILRSTSLTGTQVLWWTGATYYRCI
jgi:hypothetical protein